MNIIEEINKYMLKTKIFNFSSVFFGLSIISIPILIICNFYDLINQSSIFLSLIFIAIFYIICCITDQEKISLSKLLFYLSKENIKYEKELKIILFKNYEIKELISNSKVI